MPNHMVVYAQAPNRPGPDQLSAISTAHDAVGHTPGYVGSTERAQRPRRRPPRLPPLTRDERSGMPARPGSAGTSRKGSATQWAEIGWRLRPTDRARRPRPSCCRTDRAAHSRGASRSGRSGRRPIGSGCSEHHTGMMRVVHRIAFRPQYHIPTGLEECPDL